MAQSVGQEFELLARKFLAESSVHHEWRRVCDRFAGDRLDLVCAPNSATKVWASVRDTQIAVGSGDDHQDFEDFGRGQTPSLIAHDAFTHLLSLLRQHGHISGAA